MVVQKTLTLGFLEEVSSYAGVGDFQQDAVVVQQLLLQQQLAVVVLMHGSLMPDEQLPGPL